MEKNKFDYKLEILMKEWDYTQSHVGRFDTIIFGIRGWAVSAFTAMLVVSASQKLPHLMLLATLPVLMFWLIDALQKSFQRNFIERGNEIEKYLASNNFADDVKSRTDVSIVVPALSAKFGQRSLWARLRFVIKSALVRNVLFIYLPLLILSVLSYFFLKVQLIEGSIGSGC